MQDRVIGPLTMIQFVQLIVGFAVCYVIFNAIPRPLSYFVMIPVAVLFLAIVFIKVNERPFSVFLLSIVQFLTLPRKRVWKETDSGDTKYQFYRKAEKKVAVEPKSISHDQITKVAQKFDQGK